MAVILGGAIFWYSLEDLRRALRSLCCHDYGAGDTAERRACAQFPPLRVREELLNNGGNSNVKSPAPHGLPRRSFILVRKSNGRNRQMILSGKQRRFLTISKYVHAVIQSNACQNSRHCLVYCWGAPVTAVAVQKTGSWHIVHRCPTLAIAQRMGSTPTLSCYPCLHWADKG